MMAKRFSSHELYTLRNRIPIHILIEQILLIPSKIIEGLFRFLCPVCSEFNTATNPETNLARCFRCERSFNTIDMVMATRNVSFVESVRFLQKYSNALADKDNDYLVISRTTEAELHQQRGTIPLPRTPRQCRTVDQRVTDKDSCFSETTTPPADDDGRKHAVAIGTVLQTLGFTASRVDSGKMSVLPAPEPFGAGPNNGQALDAPYSEIGGVTACHHKSIIERLAQLEHHVEDLSRQLEQVRAMIGVIDNRGHLHSPE